MIRTDKNRVMLFDLDGVMIKPLGYRRAYYKTIEYILSNYDFYETYKSSFIPEMFEANGITSEWDMIPLTLLLILDSYAEKYASDPEVHDEFLQIPFKLDLSKLSSLEIDFQKKIARIGDLLSRRYAPAEEILTLTKTSTNGVIFPHLHGTNLVKSLLSNTRHHERSLTTRVFENLAIGSEKYRKLIGKEPVFESPSYLEKYDEVQINQSWLKFLQKEIKAQNLHAGFITARPTLPPAESEISSVGYFPEGEAAKSMLGLDIPLIGYGKLLHIANQYGLEADHLLKPSPFQALAAMIAAYFQDEEKSLETAYKMLFSNTNNQHETDMLLSLPKSIELHIFEDSFVGLQSCEKSVSILQRFGIDLVLYRWGIAQQEEKKQILQMHGAHVFDDINQALSRIFA